MLWKSLSTGNRQSTRPGAALARFCVPPPRPQSATCVSVQAVSRSNARPKTRPTVPEKAPEPMKLAYNLVVIVLGVLLVYAGLRYNVYFFRDRFSATGALPARYEFAIVAVEALLILLGVCLLWVRKRLQKKAAEVLLLVGAATVGLIVLEVGSRAFIWYARPELQSRYLTERQVTLQRRFVPHPLLGYVSAPGYRSLDGMTHHNSLGFRGDEIAVPKPDHVYRIAFVGESTTYSDFIKDDKRTWTSVTQRELRRECALDTIEVVNAGVGGYDSFQSLIAIQLRILDVEPDLVVVHHGVNDAHARMVRPEYYKGDNTGRRRPWTTEDEPWFLSSVTVRLLLAALTGEPFEPSIDSYFSSRHSAAGVRDPGYNERLGDTPMNVLKRNPPVYFARNLRNMVAVVRGNGSDILFITWPSSTAHDDYLRSAHYQQAIKEINEATVDVGRERDVFVYRLDNEMPGDADLWVENRHVNEKGAEIKARLTAKGIAEYVCPRARRQAALR